MLYLIYLFHKRGSESLVGSSTRSAAQRMWAARRNRHPLTTSYASLMQHGLAQMARAGSADDISCPVSSLPACLPAGLWV